MRLGTILLFALAAAAGMPAQAAGTGPSISHWITLGTQGGPMPSAQRSQPANLLVMSGDAWRSLVTVRAIHPL